jgi:hypothetical protein
MSDENVKALETRDARAKALAVERRRILALPPEKALDAILEYPLPVTLVQSMAEEDFYLLVHTIGPDDALPVLGLASKEQWEYLLDMETWARDRVDPLAMTEWFDRLLKADPDRFTHWIVTEQRDSFEYYLFRNVELIVREYEVDPSEIGDGFHTEDDVHYVRMRPYMTTPDDQVHPQQETRDLFLTDLLRRLSVYDFPLYQDLLLGSSAVIPAEAEEELLRLRNVRLAERGYLPFEEAVGVYQPLTLEELMARRKPLAVAGRIVESYPLPLGPAVLPEDAGLFARTLARIQDEAVLQRLQSEFAGLCNQVIAADQRPIRDKATLTPVVAKVAGYLGIGLAHAEATADGQNPYRGVNLLQNGLLADIFRMGYGRALALKWRAERWRPESWFARLGLPLAFWGEAWLGVLGGVLIKRPLYYDNFASGVLYREFATLEEIQRTEEVLAEIMAMDDLLALMAVRPPVDKSSTFLTCHNLLLTLWADHHLGLDTDPRVPLPLSAKQLHLFFEALWEQKEGRRRIKDSMRAAFLALLAERSGLTAEAIGQRMGLTLHALFAQVENELGGVAPKDLDPRFVQLFLLKEID